MTDEELKRARELCDAATPIEDGIYSSWEITEPYEHEAGFDVVDIIVDIAGAGRIEVAEALLPRDAELLRASRTLVPQLLDEVERLRAPKVLTEVQIVGALAQGRVERKCAEGDLAWISLLERNQTLRDEITRLRAEADELRAERTGKTLAPTEWIDRLTAQAEGRCLGTIGFVACGEGGNYCSVACRLRAEAESYRAVFERAVAWRRTNSAIDPDLLSPLCETRELARAIDAALDGEGKP